MRIDIGIRTQRNRRASFLCSRNAINVFQLRFALDVEAGHALLERVLDFFIRLTHAGKRTPGWVAAGCEHTIQFASGNNVETCACICEQLQDRPIGVRFDGVTNQVSQRRECGIQARIMVENCSCAVDISWSAELLRDTAKIDILAVEMSVAITKGMHESL